MRHEHLMDQTKSRGLSLALFHTHSLLIAILLFLIPSKVASKAVPDDSQNSAGISETLAYPEEGLIGLTSPIISPTPTLSIISTTLSENVTQFVDIVGTPTTTASTSTSRIAISEREITPSGLVRASPQEPVESPGSFMLGTPQKIGIGVGVPLAIICLALITYFCTKRHLIRSLRSRKRDDSSNAVGEGGFAELGTGRADGWYSEGFDSTDRSKVPSSHHIGSSAGPKEVDAWDPLSGKQSAHASSGTLEARRSIEISTGEVAMGGDSISESYQKAAREKRRPADLQPLALSAPPQRPFTAGSQASPGLFPHSSINSPQIRQGHQSIMSSKSSSTLGLTAFFQPGHGHERHGSASTRISQKSRKGSTATMMTSNYEMEMATLSSASEPQFPITPRDYDGSLSGGIFPGRVYRNSGYSCFDPEREEIAAIKSQAYLPQPQTPSFIPPALSSPSLNARSRHRHSRTSSSGINAANFVNSIPSVFSSPKVRPGTSPLAAGAKGKTVRKEDIRVINHETTYFDDRDDEEDEDVDSLHSNLPQIYSDKRHSRRHSAGMKRISKGQLSEVDGEEVWTDSEDEQDSDFVIAGGLGSRFGKKNLDMPA